MIDIVFVCAHCRHHEHSKDGEEVTSSVEINFKDKKVYWLCPACKKMNELTLKAETPRLPKTRRIS